MAKKPPPGHASFMFSPPPRAKTAGVRPPGHGDHMFSAPPGTSAIDKMRTNAALKGSGRSGLSAIDKMRLNRSVMFSPPPGGKVPAKTHGGGILGSVLGLGKNLGSDVVHTAQGLGPGLAHTAEAVGSDVAHLPRALGAGIQASAGRRGGQSQKARLFPKTGAIVSAVGKSYAQTYGPLFIGHPGETAHRIGQHPLGPILDAAAAFTGGGSLAGKAGVTLGRAGIVSEGGRIARLGEPGEVALRARTGETAVRRTSRNPATRAVQAGVRKATTGATGIVEKGIRRELPVAGEHARAVRALSKQARRRETAEIGRALRPFNEAVRPLKPPERVAVVLAARGVKPSELRTFVTKRLEEAKQAKQVTDPGERAKALAQAGDPRDHARMLNVLSKVPDELVARVKTDPKLARAHAAAETLSTAGGDLLEAAGKLAPETRALRPYLTARVVGGARYVEPTAARLGKSPAVERQQAYVTRLEGAAGRAQSRVARRQFDRYARARLDPKTEIVPGRTLADVQGEVDRLDKQWEDLVSKRAAQLKGSAGFDKGETSFRNRAASDTRKRYGRAVEGGGLTRGMPTQSAELRQMAEDQILGALRKQKTPWAEKALASRDRAEHLRGLIRQAEEERFNGLTPEQRMAEMTAENRVVPTPEPIGTTSVGHRGELLHPTGTARLDKLNAALSVARDRLSSVEQAAAKRERPTGFVGGPPIEQLKRDLGDLIYHPDIGPALKEGKIPQQQAGLVPPTAPSVTKLNRGIRLMTSRWLPSPDAWRDAYIQAVAYAHAKARGQLALRIAKPLSETGERNKGWYYVRAGAQKPSRAATERAQLSEEMDHLVEAGDHDVESWLDQNVATKDPATASRWEKEGAQVRQISPGDYKQIFGDFRGASTFVRNLVDKPTNFWRGLTLTYRPAWVVNNFVGQTLLYALNHSGPGGAKAYAESVLHEAARRGDEHYFPEELRYGFFRAEGARAPFAASRLPGESRFAFGPRQVRAAGSLLVQGERNLRDGIQRINTALSDNIPRRAAWYAVAKRERKWVNRVDRTNRTLDQFLEDLRGAAHDPAASPKLARLHDQMVQEVLDELIDFGNLSTFERNAVRRVLPFYSWIKGIMKASARLGFEHPAKVRILELLAEQGQAVNLAAFGAGASIVPTDFPIGGAKGGEQRVLSTGGLNPFATVGQTAAGLGSLLGPARAAQDNPFLQTNPLLQSLVEAATRQDLFSGKKLASPAGQLGILAQQLALSPAPFSTAERIHNLPTGAAAQRKLTRPSAADILYSYLGLPVRTRRPYVAEQLAARKP